VRVAYPAASDNDDDPVLVERTLTGAIHHLLVVGECVVAAVRRDGNRRIEVTPRLHAETAARAVEARVIGLTSPGSR
jgi:hypothetical protein